MRVVRMLAIVTLLVLLVVPGAAQADRSTAAAGEVARLTGDTRVDTAVELSSAVHTDGATTALLATARDFPDALAGATLAAELDAPLLLSEPTETSPAVRDELERLGVTEVLVLGGQAALPDDVVAGYGVQHRRLQGGDRYATAVRIAREVVATPDRVFLATGENFPDAVAVSAWAAATGTPILLTSPDELPDAVATYLDEAGSPTVVPIGGEVAIEPSVLDAVRAAGHDVAARVAGSTRYATSHQVTRRHATAVEGESTVWVATGADYPDALAAGPAVAHSGGVFALTDPRTIDSDGPEDVRGFLESTRFCDSMGPMDQGVVVGGVNAVHATAEDQLRAVLNCQPLDDGGEDD